MVTFIFGDALDTTNLDSEGISPSNSLPHLAEDTAVTVNTIVGSDDLRGTRSGDGCSSLLSIILFVGG
jgi:hypothetical protein